MRRLKTAIYIFSAVLVLLPAACSAPIVTPAPTVIPLAPSSTATLTPSPTIPPSATRRPTDTPDPTFTPQPTAIAKNVRVKQLFSEHITGAVWSTDGKTIRYARNTTPLLEVRENYKWYTYNVETRQISNALPLIAANPNVLKSLQSDDYKYMPWFRGRVSPSGKKIIYSSSLGIPTPSKIMPDTSFVHLWAANYDGSNPKDLGNCGSSPGRVTWFAQETKFVAQCGTMGGPIYTIGDLINGRLIDLQDITAYDGYTFFNSYALSPDEETLAFTAYVTSKDPQKLNELKFVLVPLSTTPYETISDYGFSPNWSQDSKRIYYLRSDPFDDLECNSMHLYDTVAKTDQVILRFPLQATNGQPIESAFCENFVFIVSPLENAAVFQGKDGLWIVEWSK